MGIGDMMDKAQDAAKSVSDEQIDAAAGKITEYTPDAVDDKVTGLADRAKTLND